MPRSSSLSRSTVLVAGFVALVYVSLAAIAASCALSHVDLSNGHAHHGSHEAVPHNALCAWACQAMSSDTLSSEPPVVSALTVEGAAPTFILSSPALHHAEALQARAPPLARLS
jgi:hypothetical protein